MLPREADAAVHLDALLGGQHGDRRAVRLRHGHRDGGLGVVRGAPQGGVAGDGAGLGDLDPQLRQPMLEPLVGADRPAELVAGLDVVDGHGQALLGQAELFGGQDRGAGGQGPAQSGLGGGAGGQQAGRGGVQVQVGQDPGHVQGHDRASGRLTAVDGVEGAAGRDQQDVGGQGVRDAGDPAGQAAVVGGDGGRERRAGRGAERHGERRGDRAGGQAAQEFLGLGQGGRGGLGVGGGGVAGPVQPESGVGLPSSASVASSSWR